MYRGSAVPIGIYIRAARRIRDAIGETTHVLKSQLRINQARNSTIDFTLLKAFLL